MRLRHLSPFWIGAVLLLAALPCLAGEVAVLKNGFSIRYQRREVLREITRLYVTADGSSFVDVPTAEIEHFEALPDETVPEPRQAPKSPYPGSLSEFNSVGFPGRPHADLPNIVSQASVRYRLDPDLVNSLIKAESAFNSRAVSPKGAQGLMQLMPGTASQLGVTNAFDPLANVEGGTKYFRELMERFNFDIVKALAAYNAGPEKVERFGGVPPYSETKLYVRRVVLDFNRKKAAQKKASGSQNTASAPRTEVAPAKPHNPSSPVQANVQANAKKAASVNARPAE